MALVSQLQQRRVEEDYVAFDRRLRWIQVGLPVLLFVIVFVYETLEHLILSGSEALDLNFFAEVVFFGVLGPAVVALVLGWINGQVRERYRAEEHVRQLNAELEAKVRERTRRLKGTNEELAQKNEELRTLDRLKDEFVTLVSHELQSPLTSLNGGLEMLAEVSDELPAGQRDTIQIVRRESSRLTALVKNILNVSSLDAGRFRVRLGPVAVPPLLHRLVRDCQLQAPQHEFRLQTDGDVPFVLADEEYLVEILHNLLDNAVKYSPPDSLIQAKAWLVDPETVAIAVSDEGIGIPPELQEQVFEKFYRVQERENKEVYGHGLGLYFARKLLEAQGGRIEVESESGIGSTFTCTLPVAREMAYAGENPVD